MLISIAAISAVIGAHTVFADKSECHLDEDEKKEINNTPFIWTLHHNRGIACEKLKDRPRLVKIISGGTILGLIICLMLEIKDKGSRLSRLGLALVIGGGIANLADRLEDGEVTDYIMIKTQLPHLKKLVFNIADIAVAAGAVIFMFSRIRKALKNS